jgi:hypothetical protein
MDGEALILAKKYADSLALNGVPVKYPQIDPVTKHWMIFDPVSNAYTDTGSSAEGKDGKSAYQSAVENGFPGSEDQWLAFLKGENGETPQFRVNGRIFQYRFTTQAPATWTDLFSFPEDNNGDGGIEDAPADGKFYGRTDSGWAEPPLITNADIQSIINNL